MGKTTLAVHVAHQLSEVYPDGQLYVNLRGSQSQPAGPHEALGRFLRGLQGPDAPLPWTTEERAETYRSAVANRRILVVLDDAADEEQVLPLLPGSPSCAVIVTTRFRLTGLAGVHYVEAGILDEEQALQLLADTLGSQRVAAEPAAARRLVQLCGSLPLALQIAAARLAARPHWTIAEFAERLRDQDDRLDQLSYGSQDMRASLEMTVDRLSESAQRLLRRLALVPVADFAPWVAAPLLDERPGPAEEVLESLAEAHLISAHRWGRNKDVRFRMPNLVRVYAREQLAANERVSDRRAALGRLLDAWLGLIDRTWPARSQDEHDLPPLGVSPQWPLTRHVVARLSIDPLTWYDDERHALIATVRQACENGAHEIACAMALAATNYFGERHHWAEWAPHPQGRADGRAAGRRSGL